MGIFDVLSGRPNIAAFEGNYAGLSVLVSKFETGVVKLYIGDTEIISTKTRKTGKYERYDISSSANINGKSCKVTLTLGGEYLVKPELFINNQPIELSICLS